MGEYDDGGECVKDLDEGGGIGGSVGSNWWESWLWDEKDV